MSYSLILPTLNESGHIIQLINQINKILKKTITNYEIIVVDDNSVDGTPKLVKQFLKKKSFLRLIQRKEKKNLAESIYEGVKKSKYTHIIWLDADFQHPPRFIKNLIVNSNRADMVICSRFLHSSKRYFMKKNSKKSINENPSIFFNKICNFLLFNDITDYTSGFV